MTGTAAEIKHGTSQPGQVPPDEVDVSLVLLRPVADQADVLLGHRRVRGRTGGGCCGARQSN